MLAPSTGFEPVYMVLETTALTAELRRPGHYIYTQARVKHLKLEPKIHD